MEFLSSLVESIGSAQIEKQCADSLIQPGQPNHFHLMEKVRAFKEGRGPIPDEAAPVFKKVISRLQHDVAAITGHVVSHGLDQSPEARRRQNQFGRTKVLFAGGGLLNFPYRAGVVNAFQENWNFVPDTVDKPRPNDLLRASDAPLPDAWFRRLTVAYGLSFPRSELQKITLPNQLPPLPDPQRPRENGRCVVCGRPTVSGDDYCYSHR